MRFRAYACSPVFLRSTLGLGQRKAKPMKLSMTLVHTDDVTVNQNGGMSIGKMIDERLRDILHDDSVQIREIGLSFTDVELQAMKMLDRSGAVKPSR